MYKFIPKNIDRSLPIVTFLHKIEETCNKCQAINVLTIQVKANPGQLILMDYNSLCGNKNCKNPMNIMTSMTSPEK